MPNRIKYKGKFRPRSGHKGAERESRNSSTLSLTWALGGVGNATPQPHYPREWNPVSILYEGGWVPGPLWTSAENLAPTGMRSPERLTHSEAVCRLSYRGSVLNTRDQVSNHYKKTTLQFCILHYQYYSSANAARYSSKCAVSQLFLWWRHSERRRLLNELQVLYGTFLYRDCDPGLGMDRKPCSAGSRERISGHRKECSMHGSATRTGKSRLKEPKPVR